MKVKMLQGMAGPDFTLRPGDIYEFKSEEAKRLFEHGIAQPVKQKREKSTLRSAEKAILNEA